MKKTIQITTATAACLFMVAGFMVAILTPLKTINGDFTNPREYWTNPTYRCEQFGIDCWKLYQDCITDESCECMSELDGQIDYDKAVEICEQ